MAEVTWGDLQTKDHQETMEGGFAYWAVKAILANSHIATNDLPNTEEIPTSAIMSPQHENPSFDLHYPQGSLDTVECAIDGSGFDASMVDFAMVVHVDGCEYLFLMLSNDVYAVLSGSQLLKAEWV